MDIAGKRILVTGSRGFVGRVLLERLRREGARVVSFDLAEGKDVTDWHTLARIRKVDLVYHLAAVVFVPASQSAPLATFQVNLLGTLNVLELCRLRGAGLVFASSYVYGPPRYLPVDEDHPLAPNNPYAWSKVLGEELCRSYHQQFGVPCLVLRPFNIYGEGQDRRFLVPEIVSQIASGDVVRLKDLSPRRDMLYLEDAVEAYLAAGRWLEGGFDVVNIGSGHSYSVEEIARTAIALSGREIPLEATGEKRRGEVPETVAGIDKARRLLGWEPQVSLEEGLRRTLEAELGGRRRKR